MTLDIILGLVRALLTTAGGSLIAHGVVTQTDWTAFVGVACALVGAAWSVLQKQAAAKALLVAKASPADPAAVSTLAGTSS